MSYVQQAIDSITGFAQRYKKFLRELTLSQYSRATIQGYTSKVALISLHYKRLPELLSEDEIRDYLAALLSRTPIPGRSIFVHTIVGLRCYYKFLGYEEKRINLPHIRSSQKLPVVLSESEMVRLLRGTLNIREKAILATMYSCGLRVGELCRLEIVDIDSSRMTVHIRQGKGRKDRYIPLSVKVLPVLRSYYKQYRPQTYLFNGYRPGSPLRSREATGILKTNCKLNGIHKAVTCHSIRHTYATHLLEMGENTLRIKELLGHRYIKSTLIYLHIALVEDKGRSFSPLDVLFKDRQG
jgi:site-specific recombinase XerD